MAVEAVLPDRRVLEQEGATLFGVAAITDFVDAVGLEQGICRRAVRVVTVHAGDLPFRQRHVRSHVELRALHLVTGKAGLVDGLARCQTVRGEIGHRIVTVAAGELVVFVNRPVPENPRTALVARKALGVLGGNGCQALVREADDR